MGNVNVNNLASDMKPAFDLTGTAIADQSLAVAGSAVAMIATALDARTTHVFFDVQDASVNVTFDSSAPVGGSNGHRLAQNTSGVWSKQMAEAARFIREGATSARIHISEFQIK